LKIASSYRNLKKIVWNHTRQQSKAFIATCPVCIERAPVIKPLKTLQSQLDQLSFVTGLKLIPHVNASINCKEQDGKHGISLYEVVFNMPYKDNDQVLPTDLRKCETVNERIKLLENSKFKDMMEENEWDNEFMSKDEDDQSVDTYWSNSSSISDTEGPGLTDDKTTEELKSEAGDVPNEIDLTNTQKLGKSPSAKSNDESEAVVYKPDVINAIQERWGFKLLIGAH
jgi:hypothetical protein